MAKNTETLTIKVDAETDQARRDLHALEEAADDITIKVDTDEAERSIDDLLQDVDKLSSEDAIIQLKLAQENLQGQLASIMADVEKLDASDPTIDIKMEQGNAVASDLDRVTTKLADVDDKSKKMSDSARGANSALANMVGNSAQDLGALSGVAGSVGVAIGQMAEYASDATLAGEGLGSALGSMVKVIGPIAALSAGLFLVSKAMGNIQQNKALDAERAQAYAAAIEDAGTGAAAVVARLREADEIMTRPQGDVFGFEQWLFGKDPIDVVDQLNQINVSAEQLGTTFDKLRHGGIGLTDDDFDAFLATDQIQRISLALEDLGISGQANSEIIHSLFKEYQAYGKEAGAAEKNTRFFASSVDGLNEKLGKIKLDSDPFSEFQTTWNSVIRDLADGSIDFQGTAVQVDFLAKHLGITSDEVLKLGQQHLDEQLEKDKEAAAEAAQAVQDLADALGEAAANVNTDDFRGGAISAVFDQLNELSRLDTSSQLTDIADAFTAIDDAARAYPKSIVPFDLIPDNWDEVKDMPDDLKGITDAIGGFRDAVQTQLAEAFQFGGPEALRRSAEDIRTQFEGPFREMMARNNASVEETNDAWNQFLRDVGLAPENIEMTVTLAIDQQKLQVLRDIASGAGLEGEHKLNFDIAISNNDPTTALAILNEQLASVGQEVTITYNADTGQVETKLVPLTQPVTVPVSTGAPDTSATDAALATYTVSGITVPVGTQTNTDEVQTALGTVTDPAKPRTAPIIAVANNQAAYAALTSLVNGGTKGWKPKFVAVADTTDAQSALDTLATERTADIKANATNVATTDTTLDTLAMPSEDGRLAHIFAQPTNVAAAAAILDALVHDRTVHLRVQIDNYNDVERQLDQLARPRTQVITTRLGGSRTGAAVN